MSNLISKCCGSRADIFNTQYVCSDCRFLCDLLPVPKTTEEKLEKLKSVLNERLKIDRGYFNITRSDDPEWSLLNAKIQIYETILKAL